LYSLKYTIYMGTCVPLVLHNLYNFLMSDIPISCDCACLINSNKKISHSSFYWGFNGVYIVFVWLAGESAAVALAMGDNPGI